MNVRENWRIILLAVLIVVSGVALFAPTGASGNGDGSAGTNETTATAGNGTGANQVADTGMTNLQFGLQLSGGTRIRAGLVGITAENVPLEPDGVTDLEETVANELGVDVINVRARASGGETGTVEVYTENPSESAFRAALEAGGVDTSDVTFRDGVTDATRQSAVNTIQSRINQGGLTGGTVSTVNTATGEQFVVVEVPNVNRSGVLDRISERGTVQVKAIYPVQTENGTVYRNETVLEQGDFRRKSQPQDFEQGTSERWGVRVTLTEEAAPRFQQAMNERDFTTDGVDGCHATVTPDGNLTNADEPGYCLYTIQDDEVVYAASLGGGDGGSFVTSLRDGSFLDDPQFVMFTNDREPAFDLKFYLDSGALPTTLDVQSELYLAPSLAQKFKPLALITGLVAWLTVAGVVYIRYREPKVAIPMVVTASAEVWLLLGFAAAIGLALDLSHIAGLIAVIGTGVDDLVIIADEILQRGEIATDRVFRNRFRKAFWVIGAAAATTIIAMSPLAVLSLGDLQGFAIVTIVGVLIGVLITRPAYGDVLKKLLLEMD